MKRGRGAEGKKKDGGWKKGMGMRRVVVSLLVCVHLVY